MSPSTPFPVRCPSRPDQGQDALAVTTGPAVRTADQDQPTPLSAPWPLPRPSAPAYRPHAVTRRLGRRRDLFCGTAIHPGQALGLAKGVQLRQLDAELD